MVWGTRSFERNRRLTSNLRILAAGQVEIGQLAAAREIVRQHLTIVPDFSLRTIDGDKLVIKTEPNKSPVDGREGVGVVTLERIKPAP